MEILDLLPTEHIHADELPALFRQSNPDRYQVYVVTPSPEDMYYRRSDHSFHGSDWRNHPSDYDSKFAKNIAPYSHVLVNCIYWDARYARLLTKDDAQTLHENGQNRCVVCRAVQCVGLFAAPMAAHSSFICKILWEGFWWCRISAVTSTARLSFWVAPVQLISHSFSTIH